jgi:hypothetical protein
MTNTDRWGIPGFGGIGDTGSSAFTVTNPAALPISQALTPSDIFAVGTGTSPLMNVVNNPNPDTMTYAPAIGTLITSNPGGVPTPISSAETLAELGSPGTPASTWVIGIMVIVGAVLLAKV